MTETPSDKGAGLIKLLTTPATLPEIPEMLVD